MFKGVTNGTLLANEWDCAATGSGILVPHGESKTTNGGCNMRPADQWETAMMPNLRNGTGLATPGAMLSAPSQGSSTSRNFPH